MFYPYQTEEIKSKRKIYSRKNKEEFARMKYFVAVLRDRATLITYSFKGAHAALQNRFINETIFSALNRMWPDYLSVPLHL